MWQCQKAFNGYWWFKLAWMKFKVFQHEWRKQHKHVYSCFLLPSCWNTVNQLKFTATKQCPQTKQSLPIIPIGTIHTLLRFENLCQNSWCMLGQMTMTTMIWWWWWWWRYCNGRAEAKRTNHMHIVCPWRRYHTILLQSSNLIWLELKSILIKRTDSVKINSTWNSICDICVYCPVYICNTMKRRCNLWKRSLYVKSDPVKCMGQTMAKKLYKKQV